MFITLKEASKLVIELYKRGKTQNEGQYQNFLDKYHYRQMELSTEKI